MTAVTAACVIISNMVGTGVFGTTGFMARDIGHPGWIMAIWLAGGVFALLGAICYSELGAAMPRVGGEYVYLREAYGPLWGFLAGWTSFTAGFGAPIAANAYLFAIYLGALIGGANGEADSVSGWRQLLLSNQALALGMVWLLTAIHVVGVALGSRVQQGLTLIKLGAVLLLVVGGVAMGRGDWGNLTVTNPNVTFDASTLLVSFLFVTFAYSGWNAAGYIAGEMKDPGRTIPRASIVATGTVCVLYLALNAVYFYALPVTELAGDPIEPVGQKAAVAMFGTGAATWITALLAMSIFGATSAMIWAGPRVYFAMARDGVFPRMFARTRSGGTPVSSIVLQSVWVSLLIILGGFEQLVVYAGFAMIAFSALAVGAVIVLRIRRPDLPRPFRARPYPLVPILYLLVSIAVMIATLMIRSKESLLGLGTVLVGIPLYFYWSRSGRRDR